MIMSTSTSLVSSFPEMGRTILHRITIRKSVLEAWTWRHPRSSTQVGYPAQVGRKRAFELLARKLGCFSEVASCDETLQGLQLFARIVADTGCQVVGEFWEMHGFTVSSSASKRMDDRQPPSKRRGWTPRVRYCARCGPPSKEVREYAVNSRAHPLQSTVGNGGRRARRAFATYAHGGSSERVWSAAVVDRASSSSRVYVPPKLAGSH